jgi:hypothetical protein
MNKKAARLFEAAFLFSDFTFNKDVFIARR